MAKEIISQLDEAQPQLAIEILILSVTINDSKAIVAQLRSKEPNGIDGLVGKNVEFQTSGFLGHGIQERSDAATGSYRLLADLVNLAKGAAAGNTILTLGSDMFGVWGIFRALQTVSNTQIISNPFLVATNKTKAKVSIGRTIRVVTSTIIATGETPTYGDEDAKLEVEIMPQINSDGMIVLELKVSIVNFVQGTTETSVAKTIKEINTKTIVADKEILALGGLIQNKTNDNMNKIPVLGDIPLLGWLFKNKEKDQTKDNLLILISTQIIEPRTGALIGRFTQERINDYYRTMGEMHDISEPKDPIYRAFFAEKKGSTEQIMNDFLITKRSTKKSKAATKKVAKKTKKRSRKEHQTTRVAHNKINGNSIKDQHNGGIKI
jgi:general secretion pathway protein D